MNIIEENIFNLKGKNVILIGASSGIGESIAMALIKYNANVVGTYNSKPISISFLIKNENFIPYQLNIENISDDYLENLWTFTLSKFKCLPDILINCAGINLHSWIEDYPINDWNKVLDINLTSPFKMCQYFAKKHIEKNSSAKIINISSLTSFQAGKNCTGYTVSKHGLMGLTKILANELGKYNITANCIAPGYIYTDMTSDFLSNSYLSKSYLDRIALGRWGKPEDIQGAAIFLCSDASNYITGSTIIIDGGYLNS